MSDFLGGHPAKLREALRQYETAGFESEAAEARARLPQVASAYLSSRLAEGDMKHLHEAIVEAEYEGLSEQAAEARTQLPRLVQTTFNEQLLLINPMSYYYSNASFPNSFPSARVQ